MRNHKFQAGDKVRVIAGDFAGETGEVFEYLPLRGYIVRLMHEGYPESHYHHVRVEERHLEKTG